VTAVESRSQHENKARALRRLREAIAIQRRVPAPRPVRWPAGVQVTDACLHVSPKNPAWLSVIGLVLDVLAEEDGHVREAAERLGVTSSSMTRFLAEHPKAWTEANRIRRAAGLAPLVSS
jgi:hypothetical protein